MGGSRQLSSAAAKMGTKALLCLPTSHTSIAVDAIILTKEVIITVQTTISDNL